MKLCRVGAMFGAGLLSVSMLSSCAGGGNESASVTGSASAEPASTLCGTVTGYGFSALLPLAKPAIATFS